MKKSIALAAVVGLFGLATVAQAAPAAGKQYEVTLSGIGANDNDFKNTSLSAQGTFGYYINDMNEVSLRQSVVYSDAGGPGRSLDGNTAIAYDYLFDAGQDQRVVPYVGASIGYKYGDSTDDSITAGLEAGAKYYVNDTTFIFGQVGYDFLLKESFGDGSFAYSLGVGFRF